MPICLNFIKESNISSQVMGSKEYAKGIFSYFKLPSPVYITKIKKTTFTN